MKKIIAFGASNSKASINKKLAVYAANKIEHVSVEILDLNDYVLPIYSIDYELENGIPELAKLFLDKIKNADGIVLSLAEHNGAYTVAFKNIFDWMSRVDGKLWSNVPMLLMATSPGARGAATVLKIASDRFKYMGGNIVSQFILPEFNANFKETGLNNLELEEAFNKALLEFKAAL